MPAFQQEQSGRVSETESTWGYFVKTVESVEPRDPLAEWKSAFEAWRNEIQRFRDFESNFFFKKDPSPLTVRIHRGFLCSLISEGERLAIVLLRRENDAPVVNDDSGRQIAFIDEFVLNLRSTLETWHSMQEPPKTEKNPLTAFA